MPEVSPATFVSGPFGLEPAPSWFRKGFAVFCTVSVLAVLLHMALGVWARNEIAPQESIVALHATMLANDGTLYYNNDAYPYTITPYMPIFYTASAVLIKIGIPGLLAGRLISFAAMIGVFIFSWKFVLLYTRSRWYGWLTVALCASCTVIPGWGVMGRVDMLAIFFGVAAFHQYARYAVAGHRSLHWVGVLLIAAMLTKQTMVAGPIAIFALLWMEEGFKRALRFGAATLAGGLLVFALLYGMFGSRFLFNTIFANVNPFAFSKLSQHFDFYLISLGQLVLVAVLGGWRAIRSSARAPFVYLIVATLVLAATAGKIGSDTNYHLESAVLLAICVSVSLHSLDFFTSMFLSRKTWVTLLQVPLLIHTVNNVRIMIPFFQSRFVQEYEMEALSRNLGKHLQDKQPILAMDFNSLLRTRGRLDIEPVIYNILVQAGRIDPEPLRRDIEAERLPVIMLHQDIDKPDITDPEFPTLPSSQLAEIRKHYRFVEHVDGPYMGGVFVYKPLRLTSAVTRVPPSNTLQPGR